MAAKRTGEGVKSGMKNLFDLRESPASAAMILLYGIVFLFAATYYIEVSWRRAYTILLYSALVVWVGIIYLKRIRQSRPTLNLLDLLFLVFTAAVLISMAINWWAGTWRQLTLMPVFFLLPYFLGRIMLAEDCYRFRNIIVGMGVILLLLILPEYLRVLKYGLPYEHSTKPWLFGQGHGVMLSGLLLSVTYLGLISILLSPDDSHSLSSLASCKGRYLTYAILLTIIVTMGWISSRGPALGGLIGMLVLFLLAPRSSRKRKFEILLTVSLGLAIAISHSLQRKANAEFYARLLQPPVVVAPITKNAQTISQGAAAETSILGAETCKRIVDSVSDRWVHYVQAASIFLEKPLFGAGANHYGFYACTGPGSFPHSTILQVFAELGIVVGFIYCMLIVMTVLTFMRRRRIDFRSFEPIWSWFVAFSVVQLLIAQLNGDYFISAALYFVIGVAASAKDGASTTPKAL